MHVFAYNIPFIVTIKKCSMQYFWQNFMEVLYSVGLPVLRKYYHFFQTTLPLVLCPLILTQEPLLNGICYQNIEGPIVMKWWKSLRTQNDCSWRSKLWDSSKARRQSGMEILKKVDWKILYLFLDWLRSRDDWQRRKISILLYTPCFLERVNW